MKIIHIAQLHKLPFGKEPTPEILEAVALSQFKVAREVKGHPGCPVLVEGLCEDAHYSETDELTHVVKTKLFPKGLPQEFNKLSLAQKRFLYTEGGAHTLFFLGEIHTLYRATRPEISHVIERDSLDSTSALKKTAREILVMDYAKNAALKNTVNLSKTSVIIIFGSAHDFKPYCQKKSYEHVLINTIDDSNTYTTAAEEKVADNKAIPTKARPTTVNTPTALLCRNLKPAFFTSALSSQHVVIPQRLQKILNNSGLLHDFRIQAHVNLPRLVDLFEHKPWVISALLCKHIRTGLYEKHITLDQLSQLTAEQSDVIKQPCNALRLKTTMEAYTKPNTSATSVSLRMMK